jgi:hypothetical protein
MGSLIQWARWLLAWVGLFFVAGGQLLYQTSDSVTPCGAVVHHADPLLPQASHDVVESCLGKGKGLAGVVVDLGLAVTGSSREKVTRKVQEQMRTALHAHLMNTSQWRCTVLLAETAVGRSNGGVADLVASQASQWRAGCMAGSER